MNCETLVIRHRMDPPAPCGTAATGYVYHEASETWAPACDRHRTHDLRGRRLPMT
jgi:hypothetical protein